MANTASYCYRASVLHRDMAQGWRSHRFLWWIDPSVRQHAQHHWKTARNFALIGEALERPGTHVERTEGILVSLVHCLELTAKHGISDPENGCLSKHDLDFLLAETGRPVA